MLFTGSVNTQEDGDSYEAVVGNYTAGIDSFSTDLTIVNPSSRVIVKKSSRLTFTWQAY